MTCFTPPGLKVKAGAVLALEIEATAAHALRFAEDPRGVKIRRRVRRGRRRARVADALESTPATRRGSWTPQAARAKLKSPVVVAKARPGCRAK